MSRHIAAPEQGSAKGYFCGDCDEKGDFSGNVLGRNVHLIAHKASNGVVYANLSRDTSERGREWKHSCSIDSDDPDFAQLAELGSERAALVGDLVKTEVATCEGKVDGLCPVLCVGAIKRHLATLNQRRGVQLDKVVDDANCSESDTPTVWVEQGHTALTS